MMKILIIDDDPAISRLARSFLATPHVEVRTAATADEGCAVAKSDPPDAILLDYQLEGSDGTDVLCRLRGHMTTATVPVIFLSARRAEDASSYARNEAAGWIQKPFDPRELRAQLASFLGRDVGSPTFVSSTPKRDGYIGSARDRLKAVRYRLGLLDRQPSKSILEKLRLDFHRFAGSGATFGYPLVSDLGAQAEKLCDDLIASGSRPERGDMLRLQTIATGIGRELGTTVAPQPGREVAITAIVDSGDPHDLQRILSCAGIDAHPVAAEKIAAALAASAPDILIAAAGSDSAALQQAILQVRMARDGEQTCVFFIGAPAGDSTADLVFDRPLSLEVFLPALRSRIESRGALATGVLAIGLSEDSGAFIRTVVESAGNDAWCDSNGSDLEADLSLFEPEILLLGESVDPMRKAEIARQARRMPRWSLLPIIAFDGSNAPMPADQWSVPLFDDQIRSPIPPSQLLTIVAARSERYRMSRRLTERDGLTDLFTRAAFCERLRSADTMHSALGVLRIAALDALNATQGRRAGDLALLSLSTVLRARIRQGDIACRLDGSSVAVLLKGAAVEDARTVLRSMKEEHASALERWARLVDVQVVTEVCDPRSIELRYRA